MEFDSWLNAKQTAGVIFANPLLFITRSLLVLADVTPHGDSKSQNERVNEEEKGVVIILGE